MIYQVSKASKAYGADVIFENVTFDIKGTEKIAIVGRNGCGKTTFLRCMCDEESFDKGTISKQGSISIGYLSQKAIENEYETVRQELMKAYRHVFEIEKKLHEVEEIMMNDHSEKVLNQYAVLQEKFESLNGYHWESEMNTVFTKFGFPLSDLERRVNEFSGGQKTRIAFVKLLLSKPDILLLDEPTNHLDLEAIEWLEGYVKNYPKAVVIVSHDRMFLDHVVDCVYNMEYGKMKRYTGNYSSFVQQRENDLERQQAAYERQQKDIQRLEALIEKFRYKKNKAAFAQSKIKYLDRMDIIEPEKTDTKTFHARFTPRVKGGEKVLETDRLKIGYDHVLTEVTMQLRRGDRVAILGPNGTGKSTFVKTVMDIVRPLGGSYLFGHQIETGYFDQQLAQFSSGKTVLDELWDENPDLDRTTIRSVLGQFLFSADDVFKTVDVLSGGEKVRLSFAKLLLEHPNFLILDEPTNHLDIPGKEALEESLKGFTGSVLFVSHDRYFIQQLANKLIVFENGTATFYELTYQEYMEKKKEEQAAETVEKTVKEKQVYRKRIPSNKKEIEKLEKQITDKEQEIQTLEQLSNTEEYYQDFQKMRILEEKLSNANEELMDLMDQWENLSQSEA